MKHQHTFALIFFVLISSFSAISQKKYDKLLQKADDKYEYGDYKKAIKGLKAFKAKIDKLGNENVYTPTYFLREARYYWAFGIVTGFENSLSNALASSIRLNGEKSENHIKVKLEVADIYMLYGNFVAAKQQIDESKTILKENFTEDNDLNAKADLYLAMTLSNMGFYQAALGYITDREQYFRARIANKESYTTDKGDTKTRKLTEKEIFTRYAELATLLSYKARTYGDMGDMDNAYASYEKTRDWIDGEKKYLGSDSYEYIEHQFAFANFKVANGLDPDLLGTGAHKEEGYGRILDRLKKSHNESHYLAFGIYETLLKQYLVNRRQAKYRNLKVEYERAIGKNFQKNSLHQINLDKLDFNSKLDRDKTKNLEDMANSILANTQTLPKNHKITIDVLDFLYRIAIKERNFKRAEDYLQEIISIQQSLFGKDSPKSHLARIKLANFYVDYTNKIIEANDIYTNSFYGVVDKEISPMHEDYIGILTHIAALREYQDNYDDARTLLNSAMRIALMKYSNKEDIEYAKILEKVAKLQINMGEYVAGGENINFVLEVYDKLKIKNDEYTLVNLVMAQQTKATLMGIYGFFDDAEDLINESKKLLEGARTLEGYNSFESDDELAGLYVFLGRYSDSEELLAKLLIEYEKIYGAKSGKILPALINQGRLQLLLGNYNEAEKTAKKANEIAVSVFGETSTKTAETLMLLGEIQVSLGDYEQATSILENAVRIQEARFGKDHINVALAMSQLGVARFYNDEPVEEVEKTMLLAAENIKKNLSDQNPRYAEVLTNLAKVYIQSGKFNEAFKALQTSENIWVSITGRRGSSRNVNVGKVNLLTGDLHYSQKNYTKAEEYYVRARDNFKRSLNSEHPEYVKVLSRLSRVYYMQGNADKAKNTMEEAIASYDTYIKRYFGSLSEREKAKFWNTIKPDYEFYNTLAIQYMSRDENTIGTMYNNALQTKALLLNSSIKVRERILSSGDEELISKFQDWLKKKELMTKVLSMSVEEQAQNDISPARLYQEVEELEKFLSEKSEDFGNKLEESNVTWEQVRSALGPNEVALEMVRFRYFEHTLTDSVVYAVLYLKNERDFKKPKVILLHNGQDLENRFFKFYRNAIILQMDDPVSYGQFWEPIVSKIGNLNTIYLSPDGVYNQINLEAIPISENKYVLDNSNIVLVSNTKDIFLHKGDPKNTKPSSTEALMFGNPDFYRNAEARRTWPQLPETEKEVTELRRLLASNGMKSDYYTKDEATEEQIKAVLNPSILHIATHGFFTEVSQKTEDMELKDAEAAKNPLLQTGLILTGGGDLFAKTTFNYNLENGILTAYEAMNLNLDKTDLVVLSACETGLGKLEVGEGVYGLQRAFLVAGAKTLIMSMFKVDDTATQKLMVLFYKKWLETGDKRKAFVDAKKELRNEYQQPIYWGAFLMIGLD